MKNLFKSLSAFQKEIKTIHKGTEGYGYSYADLPTIFDAINPVLEKYGLGFTQLVGNSTIETILFHAESGEQLNSMTAIPEGVQLKGMNDFQVLGSAITYIRRYALSAMLGLVTDKDTDASGEQTGKKPTQQNQKASKKPWLNRFKQVKNGNSWVDTDQVTDEWMKEVKAVRAGEKTPEQVYAQYNMRVDLKPIFESKAVV